MGLPYFVSELNTMKWTIGQGTWPQYTRGWERWRLITLLEETGIGTRSSSMATNHKAFKKKYSNGTSTHSASYKSLIGKNVVDF